MKVITFSRFFPAKHPRQGEETFFVEKIWKGLKTGNRHDGEYTIWSKHPRLMKAGYWQLPHIWRDQMCDKTFKPKYHTIRAGDRWQVGEKFAPRIWSGKAYASKQIEFAPPIEIKKIWNFCLTPNGYVIGAMNCDLQMLTRIAENDGLTADDFELWFAVHPKAKKDGFFGRVICWNEKIEYT